MRVASIALIAAAVVSVAGCSHGPQARDWDLPTQARCALPGEPVEVAREGESVLLLWDGPWLAVYDEPVLPVSDGLATFRQALIAAEGVQRRPIADAPDRSTPYLDEVWRREFLNQDVALGGGAGEVRPIRCLEALFFAYQADRYSQLEQPTEFIVAVVRKEVDGVERMRAWFGAGPAMFPPKSVYPFSPAIDAQAEGWRFWVALHNHTVQTYEGKPVLGAPAPSTNDVHLSRNLAQDGLERVWVTNGFYTVDIPADALAAYRGPVPREPAAVSSDSE